MDLKANVRCIWYNCDGQVDMKGFDGLSIDWQISMAQARKIVGPDLVLAGNVDPMVLYCR